MTRYLIFTSLVLLGVFEALWLRKVWQEQYEGLQQETDYVFQRTVATLQDSLVRRSIAKHNICTDSLPLPRFSGEWNASVLPPRGLPPAQRESKTNMVLRLESKQNDRRTPDTARYSQVQVFVATTDSQPPGPGSGIDRLLLNLPGRIHNPATGEFVYRIEKDTIATADLEAVYRNNLRGAGIDLPFHLVQSDSLAVHPSGKGMATQPAFAGLLIPRFYFAVFDDYRGYLLRQMLSSFAFALLLFGVTAAAFALIYRSLRQQQRLARLKNEFISNITHELKTPITTVGVALEALSGFEALHDPEKTREYLAASKLELDRLSLLVEKVLRLSMFEEQEPRLQLAPLDLAALVQQVVTALTLQAERAGATIRLEVPDGPSFTVSGDRLHLSGVVFNLLDNALKYGGKTPDIRVELEKMPESVRLLVRDHGIGIPPEYQSRVFDKFFRVPGSDDRHDVKGHGLGLSYAAQVVRQHGGTIRVESAEGKGAVFIVELPL